jgi:uncharacterized protein YndB with AHSA1/START domain
MKATDVVAQLAVKLPEFTDKFTSDFSITSLTRSGSTITAVTSAAHGLVAGNAVNIQGSESPITITSLTRSTTTGTLVTGTNHDLTEETGGTVEISGATEPEFNGTFTILSVVNRQTITFTMSDSGPTTATGSPLLLNGSSYLQSYNGLFAAATVPTTTSFTYTLAGPTLPPLTTATGTIVARINPRISAGISQERCLAAYTAGSEWCFVILGDAVASKSRRIDSDAVENLQKGENYRQQLVQSVTIMVVLPAKSEIAAANARDVAEDLLLPFCKSLLGVKFDSQLTVGAQNPLNFVDHGFAAYTTAYYVHTYEFQTVADITFSDTIGYDDNVAFRDIDTNILLDVGTGEDAIEANVNLDETAL